MRDMKNLLAETGDLHDCRIGSISWSVKMQRLEVNISDLNANFVGLPEYEGKKPGRLVLDGVRSVQIDAGSSADSLWIYEASCRDEVGGARVVELLLSPSGRIVVHCLGADVVSGG